MVPSLSRRDFFKLGESVVCGLLGHELSLIEKKLTRIGSVRLGRVTGTSFLYAQPSLSAKNLGWFEADTILNIYEERTVEGESAHNPIWLRVDGGWVHSAFVQPVRNELNTPILVVPPHGFPAQVTVPYTDAWSAVSGLARIVYRFYYSMIHWVDQVITDQRGNVWYRVRDDRYPAYYFVPAAHLRRIPEEELTPLSPGVADKRLEVDLLQQRVWAYENGRLVFSARCSTGRLEWKTPEGNFRIERKCPMRHMVVGNPTTTGLDLPGVPWVSYLNHELGIALHGTYWHNDYGYPRSGGCINLTPADAQWVYRWTLPVIPHDKRYVYDRNGTAVMVSSASPNPSPTTNPRRDVTRGLVHSQSPD